jgi:hypothetical protein
MTTPARSGAVQNLATVLAAINGTGSYYTTVATVERIYRNPVDPDSGAHPWIGILPLQDRYEYLPGQQIRVTLPVQLVAYVDGATAALRATAMEELLDDIIYALHLDSTRSANAVLTRVATSSTDEGDPDVVDFGTLVVDLEMVYFRTMGAT